MSAPPSLMWFRLDLRLRDNPALLAAIACRSPVIPVFIWAPEEEQMWPPGAASRWWLHQSLSRLQESLASRGSRLIIRRGPTLEALDRLVAETGAQAIFWNRRYEPAVTVRDSEVEKYFRSRDVAVETFNGSLLFEPAANARRYQVFTAFWKQCLQQTLGSAPRDAPAHLLAPDKWPDSTPLADLHLEPRIDWAGGIKSTWHPGEDGAQAELKRFLRFGLKNYIPMRDRPDCVGTSRLSPHLNFGEIGPRQIRHAIGSVRRAGNTAAADSFLRELGWREFAHHLLFHFPRTANEPLHEEFARFPWKTDPTALHAWQRGHTGYPLVDAGMRELWTTGWMHNRVRMVVASFLTKHLRIHWTEGAYWFWDTLVDADLANNTLGWQWTAGCGADAAPYFRIFNPVRQSERFDPEGNYIKRWVPELARLAPPWIHRPWDAPPLVLDAAGVKLGENYPLPIVDHNTARRDALAAYDAMRRMAAGSTAPTPY